MATSLERLSTVSKPRRGRFVGLAVTIAFFAISLGLVFLSPTYKECIDRQQEAAGHDYPKEDTTAENPTLVKAIGWGGCVVDGVDANDKFVMAVATIFIAIFTFTLWRSTTRLWEAGERQMILGNRAWVFAQPWPDAIKFLDGGKIAVGKIEVRQYGNTPAKVYELYVGFSDKEPSGDVVSYPGEPTSRQVYPLGPNNQWWHRETLETSDERPYIFGYVRYTDIWGEERESRFCYRLTRYTDAIRFPFRTAGSAAWSHFT